MTTFFNSAPMKWEVDKASNLGFINPDKSKVVTDLIFPHRELIPFTEMSDEEATDFIGQEFELDVECYPNYFLIKMKHRESGRCVVFEHSPWHQMDKRKLSWCLFAFKFVTFNGLHYDMPLVAMCLKGYDFTLLKAASNMIIEDKMRPDDVLEHFNTSIPFIQHVDLKEVAPVDGSLKKYAGRLHARRLQELPYDPNKELTYEETVDVKHYCGNDLDNTGLMKDGLKEQLKLRAALGEKYSLNLMSKSDAQIAEAVISKEVSKILNRKVKKPTLPDGYTCQYKDPGFIKFNRPELQEAYQKILNAKFHLDGAGSPLWPAGLGVQEKNKSGKLVWTLKIKIGQTVYKLGMGGIHSNEKSVAFKSDDEYILLDRDVASYYPMIVLNQRLFPKHLTEAFLTVYQWLVDSRLAAKKAGDTVGADSGKIIINGSFGKLGSKYSVLYSPDLMLQVTLTGQLCLLMLIEMLEDAKINVISANTDGIVSKVKRTERQKFEAIVKYWEGVCNFKTEETGYQALYSKDVNNYIAVKYKEDPETKKLDYGKNWLDEKEVCKLKGAYANPWPDKKAQIFRFHVNPTFQICTEAICQYLMSGTPIAHTVRNCTDLTKFISVRAVKGGAHKDRVFVGKFIRWYASNQVTGTINSVMTGNKVADTLGGRPLMDLPDYMPTDIDYKFYEDRARKMMVNIGYYQEDELKGQGRFF